MLRALFLSLVLVAALSPGAFAQEPAPAPVPAPAPAALPHVKLAALDDVAVAEGAELKLDDTHPVFFIEGRPKTALYFAVRVSREIPENEETDVRALPIRLVGGSGPPLLPSAVAAPKRELVEGKAVYAAAKKRWLLETWYFVATPGNRDWAVTLGNESLGKFADFCATLILRDVDSVTSRIKLPDGSTPVVAGYQSRKFLFPAGTYSLVVEVRGKGKAELPWTKYEKGEVKYVAVAGEPRSAPVLPAESLRKALPKINKAWQAYHKLRGSGGGAYNIGAAGTPVLVNVYFGADYVQGGVTYCEADQMELTYLSEEAAKAAHRSAKDEPLIVKVSQLYSNSWKIEPWDKADVVGITEDAKKVVGQATCGAFVVRSTESTPSLWASDGLLEKGIVYDKALGSFKSEAKRQGELVVVTGVEVK